MSAETLARSLALHRAGREFTGTCPVCGYQYRRPSRDKWPARRA
jgi:hypothetical protein